MCTPDSPPPPDYKGAAKSRESPTKTRRLPVRSFPIRTSRILTATRTVEYRIDPTTGNPVPYVKQSFSPTEQGIFDTTQQAKQATADLSLTGAKNAQGILGQSFDINSIQGIDKTGIDRNSVRDSLVARATQDNEIDRDKARSNLVAQGIPWAAKPTTGK
jgi:hypothetical protein